MNGFGSDPMALFRQVAMQGGASGGMGQSGFQMPQLFPQAQQQSAVSTPQLFGQQQALMFGVPQIFPQMSQQNAGQGGINTAMGAPQTGGLGYNFQQLMQQAMNWMPQWQQGVPQQPQQSMQGQVSPLIPQLQTPQINAAQFQPVQPAMPQPAVQPAFVQPPIQAPQPMAAPSQESINAALASAQEQARRDLADRVAYLGGGSEGGGEGGSEGGGEAA